MLGLVIVLIVWIGLGMIGLQIFRWKGEHAHTVKEALQDRLLAGGLGPITFLVAVSCTGVVQNWYNYMASRVTNFLAIEPPTWL